jgi:hypothetical protein
MGFFDDPAPADKPARQRIALAPAQSPIPSASPARIRLKSVEVVDFPPIRQVTRGRFYERGGPYRYRFTQRWGIGGAICWVLMHPSADNDEQDDPTTIRCREISKRLGYGAMQIVYACAHLVNDDLLPASYPFGEDNRSYLILTAAITQQLVFAYGPAPFSKLVDAGSKAARLILSQTNKKGHVLGLSDGVPIHPLQAGDDCALIPWSPPASSQRARITTRDELAHPRAPGCKRGGLGK